MLLIGSCRYQFGLAGSGPADEKIKYGIGSQVRAKTSRNAICREKKDRQRQKKRSRLTAWVTSKGVMPYIYKKRVRATKSTRLIASSRKEGLEVGDQRRGRRGGESFVFYARSHAKSRTSLCFRGNSTADAFS